MFLSSPFSFGKMLELSIESELRINFTNRMPISLTEDASWEVHVEVCDEIGTKAQATDLVENPGEVDPSVFNGISLKLSVSSDNGHLLLVETVDDSGDLIALLPFKNPTHKYKLRVKYASLGSARQDAMFRVRIDGHYVGIRTYRKIFSAISVPIRLHRTKQTWDTKAKALQENIETCREFLSSCYDELAYMDLFNVLGVESTRTFGYMAIVWDVNMFVTEYIIKCICRNMEGKSVVDLGAGTGSVIRT